MTDSVYRTHGYFATQELANQYCQNSSKVGGSRQLTNDETHPVFLRLMDNARREAGTYFSGSDSLTVQVPYSAWSVHHHPDEPGLFTASRQVVTLQGLRWEFYPDVPQGRTDTRGLKLKLREHLDKFLDARQTDQSLEGMSVEQLRAWRAQAAPWSLMEIEPDRWTSVQLNAAGQAIDRKPSPPDTVSVDTLLARLRPLLAPGAPDPATTDDAQQVARWRASAWQACPNPLKSLGHMPWDHPLAQTAGLSPDSHEAVWCVSPHPHKPERFLAVRLQPSPTGVSLAGLMDPLHPERLWVDNPPVLTGTLRRIWPEATIRQDMQIPLVSAAAVTPDLTVPTPSLSKFL